ncbi:MAG: DUF2225 domain-containing protein [Chthoniobacteraceae bacterium]
MKSFFSVILLLLLACVASAVNSLEREFLCPICGTHWEQRIESSGRARALRLDLRQIGDVVDPPSLPQCTKCRFPLFSEQILAQANDPAKAQAFRQLRAFVRGPDFQMLASKNPSYFALAQVQQLLKAPHRVIAQSYLRASWQVEDREAACQRLLEKAREHYVAALTESGAGDRLNRDLPLLCGEIERRLGKWDDAEKRFREMESSGILQGTPQANIPALQLRLISLHNSAPHLIDGADIAQNRDPKGAAPPDEKPMLQLENPGRFEKPEDALKLTPPPPQPPKPADLPLPSGSLVPVSEPSVLPGDVPK